MDTSAETEGNAAVDYLTELVPYRCPKCGNRRRFATMRELKRHLESDHAFKTACIKPAIFRTSEDKVSKDGENASEQNYIIKSERLFTSAQCEVDSSFENDRASPLLQSYKEDATLLELELQLCKQNEMRHKTENLRVLSGNTVNSDFKSTLDSLSKEVVKSRKQQWDTADQLYKSHDVMNGLQEAAENKCKEQRDIIRQLLDGMKGKDRDLKLATKEQNELRNEQERLYHETEQIFRRADSHNETLKRELKFRNETLDSLNDELERIKAKSSQELRAKENELKIAEEKMNRLKSERDQLVEETELILKRADADSEELRLALALKERKLREVNDELTKLRNEKQLMLLNTLEFYKRTEEGNEIMKNIIRAKDDQLDQALEQLEKMKVVQQRLVEESQKLTDQVDDSASRMRAMLEAKEQQVEEKVFQLEQLKEEKRYLENQNKMTESSVCDIEELQGMVKRKEKELKVTKRQLQDLKSFLQTAAEKERTARGKLEKFIGELITRAERAESELRSLKSQSSVSLSGNSKVHQEYAKGRDTDDGMVKDRAQSSINPSSPVKKKYTPAKPIRRKYLRDQTLAHGIVDLGTDSWQDRIKTNSTVSNNIQTKSETVSQKDDIPCKSVKSSGEEPLYSDRKNTDCNYNRNIRNVTVDVHRSADANMYFQPTAVVSASSMSSGNEPSISQRNLVTGIPRSEDGFNRNERLNYANDKIKTYPIIRDARYQTMSEHDLSARPIVPQVNGQFEGYNPMRVYSQQTVSRGERYNDPTTIRMNDPGLSGYTKERNEFLEYSYYLPQPPGKEQQELRAPTYGHDSTYSLNSFPHASLNMCNQNSSLQGVSDLLPRVTTYNNRPQRNQMFSGQQYLSHNHHQILRDNSDIHRNSTKRAIRPKTETFIKTKYPVQNTVTIPLEIDGSYIQTVSDPNLLQQVSSGRNRSEWKSRCSDRWRKSEPVQYEELQADETDFPDELYVIPRSASDDLTPQLLTPERERRERNVQMPTQQVQNTINQSRDAVDDFMTDDKKHYFEDRTDGNFDEIMDDNGILWDDMDTLPDVSDSELDHLEERLSPSGSEAIATKNQVTVPHRNLNISVLKDRKNSKTLKEISLKKSSNSEKDNSADLYHTTNCNGAMFEKQRESSSVIHEKKSDDLLFDHNTDHYTESVQRDFSLSTEMNQNESGIKGDGRTILNSIVLNDVSITRRSLTRDNSGSKRFRPIKATNSGKSSSSEKDITSGGKEVKHIMSKSPRISVHGVSDFRSDVSDKTDLKGDRHDLRNGQSVLDTQNKVSSTFEEKLLEISEKYKLKRYHDETNEEKDRIKAITDKYRQRRKDILENLLMAGSSHSESHAYSTPSGCLRIGSDRPVSLPERKEVKSIPCVPKETFSCLGTYTETVQNFEGNSQSKSIQSYNDLHGIHSISNHQGHDNNEIIDDLLNTNQISVTNIEDKSKTNDDKEKTTALFQINNFKEILQSKAADLAVNPNSTPEPVIMDKKSLAGEKEVSECQIPDLVQNKVKQGTEETIDSTPEGRARGADMNVACIKPEKNIIHKMHQQTRETDDVMYDYVNPDDTSIGMSGDSELQNVMVESESSSGGFSIFAEPIDDSRSIDGDSNTQSVMDRSHFLDTDADVDTDTESHCRGSVAGQGDDTDSVQKGSSLDYSDVQRLRSSRNTMSSASSQASLDFLDHVPFSRREIVRRRRQALCYIFTFLDTDTLFRVAEVCREWKIVSRNHKLWTRLELRKHRISGKFLSQVAKRCTKLRCLVLEDLQPRKQRPSETVEEYIESTRCSLENGLEQILKRSESTLVSLTIISCGHMLSSKCLWAASCYSRMLNHVTYLSDVDPVSAEVLWALGSGCRDIKTFKVAPIYPCQKPGVFNSKCLQLIGKCFRDLEALSIGGYDIDLSALTFVAKCCQRLEFLELNHMNVVTKSIVKEVTDAGLKSILDLQFIGTPVEPNAVKLLYSICKHLKSIEIQLKAEDYFEGTKQPGDMKRFNKEMEKLKALSKEPGLGKILKLTF